MPDLRPPRNQVELAAMHDLRARVLFKGRGRSGYDRHHPDDQSPDNHFMGCWQDGELSGTLRVDFLDVETGALRLVAIEPRLQGRGIGRKMIAAAEQFLSRAGRRPLGGRPGSALRRSRLPWAGVRERVARPPVKPPGGRVIFLGGSSTRRSASLRCCFP